MNTEVLASASGQKSSLIWNVSRSTGPAKDACAEEVGQGTLSSLSERTRGTILVNEQEMETWDFEGNSDVPTLAYQGMVRE
jgi:hypothetical protein